MLLNFDSIKADFECITAAAATAAAPRLISAAYGRRAGNKNPEQRLRRSRQAGACNELN